MIIYNETVKVEPSIAAAWELWIKTKHAPDMLATQCFDRYHLVRLLDVDDSDGPTYALQYYAESLSYFNRYKSDFAAVLQKAASDKWGQQFVSFGTVMEVIQ